MYFSQLSSPYFLVQCKTELEGTIIMINDTQDIRMLIYIYINSYIVYNICDIRGLFLPLGLDPFKGLSRNHVNQAFSPCQPLVFSERPQIPQGSDLLHSRGKGDGDGVKNLGKEIHSALSKQND